MIFLDDVYSSFRCQKHKITIYHFKKENKYTEYRCWDCLYEEEKKVKTSSEEQARRLKDLDDGTNISMQQSQLDGLKI